MKIEVAEAIVRSELATASDERTFVRSCFERGINLGSLFVNWDHFAGRIGVMIVYSRENRRSISVPVPTV